MTFSVRVSVSAAAGILLFAGSLDAQSSTAGESTALSSQQQSIARQMQAIGSTAAMRQAESFRQQSESLRRQQGVAVTASAPAIQPIQNVKASNASALADPRADQTVVGAGFYTTPWPASPDFQMPNVHVETTACAAM